MSIRQIGVAVATMRWDMMIDMRRNALRLLTPYEI
jgi:hypothetical protein